MLELVCTFSFDSRTSRLPVIYVLGNRKLEYESFIASFEETFAITDHICFYCDPSYFEIMSKGPIVLTQVI